MERDFMKLLLFFITILLFLTLTTFVISYICFRMAFYVPRKKLHKDTIPGQNNPVINTAVSEEFSIPEGEIYEPYREQMVAWMKETRALPHETMSIHSFDGLTLYGKYYECIPGAPIELMFHGYRGSAERDLSGGVQRCFALGRNVLLVDQRTSGKSQGNVITFGINESKDCLAWIDCLIKRFGPDVKIILTGISMGASTVMIAAGQPLPTNVMGILADCGYTSAKDIIKKTIREMKLPPNLLYPIVKLGAKIYGHFDLEETSPIEAMKNCQRPIIFIHGEADDFVPCEMSLRNFEACTAPKTILTVPGAGHGLGYLVDTEGYFKTVREFAAQYMA